MPNLRNNRSWAENRLRNLLNNSSFPEDHLFRKIPQHLETSLHILIANKLIRSNLLLRLIVVNKEIKYLLNEQQLFSSSLQRAGGIHNNILHDSEPGQFVTNFQNYQRLLFLLATIYDPKDGLSKKIYDVFSLRYANVFGISNHMHTDYEILRWERESFFNCRSLAQSLLIIRQTSTTSYSEWSYSINPHEYISFIEKMTTPHLLYSTTVSAVLQSIKNLNSLPPFSLASQQQSLHILGTQWQLFQLNDSLRRQLFIHQKEMHFSYVEMLIRTHDQIMVGQTLRNFPVMEECSEKNFWSWFPLIILLLSIPTFCSWFYAIFCTSTFDYKKWYSPRNSAPQDKYKKITRYAVGLAILAVIVSSLFLPFICYKSCW